MDKTEPSKGRTKFLVRNLLKGFLWLVALIVLFVWVRNELGTDYFTWLEPVYENSFAIYSIFLASEVLIGIIPPELFMIWASRNGVIVDYIGNIILLASISYAAGLIGHWIGNYLNTSKFYRLLKRNFLGKYEKYINDFGGFIIVVAALTPVPFSGIAMLMGSLHYPVKRYLLFALFRFLRFGVYAAIIWEANLL